MLFYLNIFAGVLADIRTAICFSCNPTSEKKTSSFERTSFHGAYNVCFYIIILSRYQKENMNSISGRSSNLYAKDGKARPPINKLSLGSAVYHSLPPARGISMSLFI